MRSIPLVIALFAATAPTLARDRGVPQATPAGKPVNCITIRDIRESRVRSDSVIDFYGPGKRVYRNVLPGGGCPALGFERRFSYRTSISQLCSVDIITVLQSGGPNNLMPGASCGLGKFQPVTLAGRR